MLCLSLNLLAVKIEIDARVMIGWVIEDYKCNSYYTFLIMYCRALLSRISQVKMNHLCFREAKTIWMHWLRMLEHPQQLLHKKCHFDTPKAYFIILLYHFTTSHLSDILSFNSIY